MIDTPPEEAPKSNGDHFLVPVILAGGMGTRLWPMSRENYPKQFLNLTSKNTLFQETVLRALDMTRAASPLLVCSESHYFLAQEQLSAIHQTSAELLMEPMGKNTAPAIALAAFHCLAHYTHQANPLMLVMPSDHSLQDEQGFKEKVEASLAAAEKGHLVTFGVIPSTPETGYGYIKADMSGELPTRVDAFVEKPDQATAEGYLAKGGYFWNSGIFILSASAYLAELATHAPDIYDVVKKTYDNIITTEAYSRFPLDIFERCRSESIDYAVMEKSKKVVMMPLASTWSDLGSWDAVFNVSKRDEAGNVCEGQVLAKDTKNSYLASTDRLLTVLGLTHHIVVSTRDAILVADKAHAQQVKALVATLREDNAELVQEHRKVYRPWGSYESLIQGQNFQVKHIIVNPGQRLSLQLHHHRAEHWVVVQGTAEVLVGESKAILYANQSTYVPIETKHRLTNPSHDELLEIIEIQSGDYLGEDDIVRFDDVYGRTS